MKVAVYGTWHVHADDYTRKALEHGEVIGVYEADEARRKAFCERYSLPEFATPQELLASDAEGVIVCSSTDTHPDVIVSIANAGKHIFTEKVLALTDADCDRIEAAVEKAGVKFVISLVQKYGAGQRTIKKIAESGELGKLNYLRFRNCHSGSTADWLPPHFYSAKECGGGAMIDLGAHGMYLTEWILGMPEKFTSVFEHACDKPEVLAKNVDGVEDNAITVMSYANGCIAVNETGFVSGAYPATLEIGGELGYARLERGKVIKMTVVPGDRPVTVEVELEPELPQPIVQFMTGKIEDGCGMREAKALTHMMVEAYKNSMSASL